MPMINAVVMKRQVYSVEKYLNSVTKNTNGIAIGMMYDIDITPESIKVCVKRISISLCLIPFSRDCIHVNDLCDGVEQCADGSDEDPSICTSSNELPIRLVDPDAAESGLENIRLGRVEVKYKVKYRIYS